MSNKVKFTDFPEQAVYLQDSNGDYIRHTWGTDEYWRLSPDKQVAIRYQNEAWRGHGLDAALYADFGFVRSFNGTLGEFYDFLISHELPDSEIFFQDRELHDCSVFGLSGWEDEPYTKEEFIAVFEKDDLYEIFEGHLIFFTSSEPAWHADTKI